MFKRFWQAWNSVVARLESLAATLRQADERLREGFGLDEALPGPKKVEALPAADTGDNGQTKPAKAGGKRG